MAATTTEEPVENGKEEETTTTETAEPETGKFIRSQMETFCSSLFLNSSDETLKRKGDDEEGETPEVPEKRVKTDETDEAVVEGKVPAEAEEVEATA